MADFVVCAFEDRETDVIGLKLLVCSLNRHLPGIPIHITCPVADGGFQTWLRRYPQVTLDICPELRSRGWDAKPPLLMNLLDAGHKSVVWMDSDVIVTRDFRALIVGSDTLVVAEEPRLNAYAVRQRTLGWGWKFERSLPGVNTCVVRVTSAHRDLLAEWHACLSQPDYQAARMLPFQQRMPHVLGDQDVLSGLLCSAQFAHLDVFVMPCGEAVLQHFRADGYPPRQRIAHWLHGMPPLIHCQGLKPWRFPSVPSLIWEPRKFFHNLYLEGSPYSYYARQYDAEIGGLPECLGIRTRLGRMGDSYCHDRPYVRGFAQAAAAIAVSTIAQLARRLARAPSRIYRLLRAS
jgi:hypothetical protein